MTATTGGALVGAAISFFGEGVTMTRTKKLTGAAIAAAAAGLFTMGYAAPVLADDAGKIHCEGVNSCKGKSDCKGAKNSCSGQNSCKGQGFKEMSKADCEKAKADMSKAK
jgi:hypothetical protein